MAGSRRRRRTRRVPDRETDRLLRLVADTVFRLRTAARWTQRELGARADVSQSEVSDIEHARLPDLPIGTTVRLMSALGAQISLTIESAMLGQPTRQKDAAHARMSSYVARRLRDAGWSVATEVEIRELGSSGWIDILAFVPEKRILLVIELKSELRDVGAVQRQLRWYEHRAFAAARSLGWVPARLASCLLVLDTEFNAAVVRANRELFDQEFCTRADALATLINDGSIDMAEPGSRGIAAIDPRSRRRRWVLRTSADRRRAPPTYASYAEFAALLGGPS